MEQPKYKLGDKFTKQVQTTISGNKFNLKIVGYITSIYANCGGVLRGHSYSYQIRSQFPIGEVIDGNIFEDQLDKEWTNEK